MTTRTIDKQPSTADPIQAAWDRVRKHLEDERYRINQEIGKYPTPIPACDQDYNHMLAQREGLNEELARLEQAEKTSYAAADPFAAVDEFIRSSPCIALNDERNVPDYREALEANVRRTVALVVLRRIQKLIAEREREMRLLRTRVVPIAVAVLIVIAMLIWIFGNPYLWAFGASAPVPICPPPGSVAI